MSWFRNCPLVTAERREVEGWPAGTRGRNEALAALHAEWEQAFRVGVLRKLALEPGDVPVVPASFREAYPRSPGLRVLDE